MCVCLNEMEWVSGLSFIICRMGFGLSVLGRVEGAGSNSKASELQLSRQIVLCVLSCLYIKECLLRKEIKNGMDFICRVRSQQLGPTVR